MEPIVLPLFERYIFKIDLFGIQLGATWYGAMYALGFLIGYLILIYWSNKKFIKLTYDHIFDIVFVVFLGVIIGGRIGYVIFYNLPYYLENPNKIIAVWEGGMSFHGGLIGVIVAIYIYSKIKNYHPFDILDILAILVPIGLGLGRIGNFINQELYGRVAESIPWAMVFATDPQKLPRHPSQLYEALLEGLVLFIIMYSTKNIKMPVGVRASLFGILYALFRIISEFFREPDPQIGYILGVLTMGQILSLILLVISIGLLIHFKYQNIQSKIISYAKQPAKQK
ncbi:MAG: prolipoprotein diacylglyceryl transferase [Brevinematales bacterium]|nr:prolipoprotein diacylglyceryl transferase [Brevinematales bacterium]